jgi:phenylpropionate dioxygenase-like ring-hydroxylating dioxygenase large terminal subunit
MPNSPFNTLPAAWYPLCRADDLQAGAVMPVQINGARYAVWRSASGTVSALAATCCHVGADLARGRVTGETLQCPLHHWCYGVDGSCVHIPATKAIPARARQAALVCTEAYGLVFGFVGGGPAFELPRFVDEVDPVWSRATVVDVASPYTTLVANSYDGQHFAAVHDRELLEAPQITRASRQHIAIHYRAKVVGQRISDRLMRALGIDSVDVTIHCWGGSVLHVYNQRTANTILVALLPLDEKNSRVYILTALKQKARGFARLFQPVQLAIARWLAVAFLRPDMQVLEGVTMRPRVLLPGADDCLVTWLRYWRALPRAEQVLEDGQSDEEMPSAPLTAPLTMLAEPLRES